MMKWSSSVVACAMTLAACADAPSDAIAQAGSGGATLDRAPVAASLGDAPASLVSPSEASSKAAGPGAFYEELFEGESSSDLDLVLEKHPERAQRIPELFRRTMLTRPIQARQFVRSLGWAKSEAGVSAFKYFVEQLADESLVIAWAEDAFRVGGWNSSPLSRRTDVKAFLEAMAFLHLGSDDASTAAMHATFVGAHAIEAKMFEQHVPVWKHPLQAAGLLYGLSTAATEYVDAHLRQTAAPDEDMSLLLALNRNPEELAQKFPDSAYRVVSREHQTMLPKRVRAVLKGVMRQDRVPRSVTIAIGELPLGHPLLADILSATIGDPWVLRAVQERAKSAPYELPGLLRLTHTWTDPLYEAWLHGIFHDADNSVVSYEAPCQEAYGAFIRETHATARADAAVTAAVAATAHGEHDTLKWLTVVANGLGAAERFDELQVAVTGQLPRMGRLPREAAERLLINIAEATLKHCSGDTAPAFAFIEATALHRHRLSVNLSGEAQRVLGALPWNKVVGTYLQLRDNLYEPQALFDQMLVHAREAAHSRDASAKDFLLMLPSHMHRMGASFPGGESAACRLLAAHAFQASQGDRLAGVTGRDKESDGPALQEATRAAFGSCVDAYRPGDDMPEMPTKSPEASSQPITREQFYRDIFGHYRSPDDLAWALGRDVDSTWVRRIPRLLKALEVEHQPDAFEFISGLAWVDLPLGMEVIRQLAVDFADDEAMFVKIAWHCFVSLHNGTALKNDTRLQAFLVEKAKTWAASHDAQWRHEHEDFICYMERESL